jgi:hypothetical protein
MTKKPFARIEYINCSPDYTSTICELDDIETHIECFKQDNEHMNEFGYDLDSANNMLPEIKITLIMMTGPEYIAWFTKYVEANA